MPAFRCYEITPDEKNPTASDSTMKSGYGVNQVVTARVNSSQRSATTALQNAVSCFPEFNYESFGGYWIHFHQFSSLPGWEFQKNDIAPITYVPFHPFLLIWYPDGSYTVNTKVLTADLGRMLGQPHRFTEYQGNHGTIGISLRLIYRRR